MESKNKTNYKIGESNYFTSKEINFIKKTVLKAGEVNISHFDNLIYKNPILILYPNPKTPKAVGALKIPNTTYRNKVFNKANTSKNPEKFKYELGWIVSLEVGNGKIITKILSEFKPYIYATVRDENKKMINILEQLNFKKIGKSYQSERDDYLIGLYIKE
ncbi:hypothetical protein [Aureivirga sp. CE67]|uniref:hypothetical protein n=1 Tax=Aureivirga sp. CE67 TaxID=1788983 RepID=UPI0018CB20EF|nr:hypothetical protein [Aureivirga sp. CE67]